MEIVSKNTKDTEKIAEKFVDDFITNSSMPKKQAFIVGLYGDLGVGKTAFTQAVAKKLGIKRKVNSPTFVIMKRYDLKHKDFDNIFHIDAYRLKNEKDLLALNWKDLVSNPRHIIFIEWPTNILKALPKRHHKIHISHTKEGHRNFKIKKA